MVKRKIEALTLFTGALLFLAWSTPVAAEEATVGVEVEATIPPTTIPVTAPPTTVTTPPPTVTTLAPTTTIAPTTTLAPTTTGVPVTVPEATVPFSEIVPEAVEKGVSNSPLGQAKAAAKVAKKFITQVSDGTPVAQALQQVLPQQVAAVVVPAVRTASTFAFPIGLAFAVLAFLVLQQRIDSTDPKLSAAPMAHEDDVVNFL